jgi:AcrR family transcriptional regulator
MAQVRARERRQRILDAALDVFALKGFQQAGVDEIASASGTSKGGVYFHFPGKEAMFLALLEQTARRLRARIEGAVAAEPDPALRADVALRTVVRVFSRHRGMARLFMVEALGAGAVFHRRVAELRQEFAAMVTEQLDRAVAAGAVAPLDTGVAGTAWFGAVNEVVTRWVLEGGDEPLEQVYEALAPLLARSVGLRPGQVAR